MEILTINNKKDEKFLRQKTADFDFNKYNQKEIRELIKSMYETMKKARGVGLSANQVGLNIKVFVAKLENKQYALFNPKITKESSEKSTLEEGCLSVPYTYGPVERFERVTLEGYSPNNKKIKIKAWGLLARIFQHEIDHLNGKLFIDRAKNIYKISESETNKAPEI